MILDYETLRVIWWVLLGILLIGFAIMDGFDLGVAMLFPWVSKNEDDRRIMINTIGPTWEGNQVWFILGGGAIFAAWPDLYGLSFSGFYLAMLLILLALILRPVGFKYRSKIESQQWRKAWDIALFIGGFVPSLVFGVAIGNVLQGVPFYIDDSLRPFYTGSFLALLNPFALLCGLTSVFMLMMQGASFLSIKTEGELQSRAQSLLTGTALLTALLFILGGIWLYFSIDGYVLSRPMAHDGPSNPLLKSVDYGQMAWFANYTALPLALAVPVLGIVMPLLAVLLQSRPVLAFISTSLAIAAIIATVGVSMFPFILPSSTHPSNSLMVWDSSSSHLTLGIMLVATLIFLPLVLAYTAWVYRVLRGKINLSTLKDEAAY
jgi:cytochrome bd ubiquinol oxidase subunit II